MADETTDTSTKEQVSVCVRYIKSNSLHGLEACEEFLGFCSVPVANAEVITSTIVDLTKGAGLTMAQLVGKGFDGAATMSGHVSGVSTRLQNLYPNAKYLTHCRNHALNLVVIAGCNNVPDVRNFMQTFKKSSLFSSSIRQNASISFYRISSLQMTKKRYLLILQKMSFYQRGSSRVFQFFQTHVG